MKRWLNVQRVGDTLARLRDKTRPRSANAASDAIWSGPFAYVKSGSTCGPAFHCPRKSWRESHPASSSALLALLLAYLTKPTPLHDDSGRHCGRRERQRNHEQPR